VSARGTHDELVAKPGFYRDTWLRQREAPDA
jgi:ABC-type multidrug transport system fused ATPase/permease subunit